MSAVTERDLLKEISLKLDRLIGVIVIQGKDIDNQILLLDSLGFDSRQIGELVGLSASGVRVRKSRKSRK